MTVPNEHTVHLWRLPVKTSDRASVHVDASVGFLAETADHGDALAKLAEGAFAVAVSEMALAELLVDRAAVSRRVQAELEAQAHAWGLQIVDVVFDRVDVPDEIIRGLQVQADAERRRRERIVENESGE